MVERITAAWTGYRRATTLTARGATAELVALTAAVVVLGVTSTDVLRHDGLATTDPANLRYFTTHRPQPLLALARDVTLLGNVSRLALIALFVGVWLWHRGEPLVVAAAPALALAIAGLTVTVAKPLVGSHRRVVGPRLIKASYDRSFPSGHAADSTATYLAVALILALVVLRSSRARAAVVGAAVALSAAIGVSRLVLGVHYPTDVLAGWALGIIIAIAITSAAILVAPATRRPRVPPQ